MVAILGLCRSYPFDNPSCLRRNSLICAYATVLLSLALLLLSATVRAQTSPIEFTNPEEESLLNKELELIKEEESVTIASRYEQPISQSPSNVFVITDEDIRQSGATDLPTVLRRIPGLEVMQTTGAEFNVSIRGDNQLVADKVLVMVDGRSIYVDSRATVYWKMIPVTLPEIKRIEVLKGPAEALYGFNAFDGVINIITKTPEEMKGTTLQFGGGELGTITSAAVHAGLQGKLGYRFSIGEDQNQQWRNGDALAFRAYKFNIHTEYAITELSKVVMSGGLVDSNRFDGPVNGPSSAASKPSQGYANVGYEHPNFFIRAWWMAFDDTRDNLANPLVDEFIKATDRNFSQIENSRANTYNFEGQHSLDFGTTNRLTYGVNYRHNTLSSNFINDFSREDRLGLYIQDEWQLWQKLRVIGGVRYDLDTFIHPTMSPRVALVYQLTPNQILRLGVSVAYRPPTLYETHLDQRAIITLPPPTPSPPIASATGTPNLGPEKIVSYQAGYQGWFFNHRLRARADLFFNHLEDLITTTAPHPVNGTQADIYGGEAGLDFMITKWLSGYANGAYQEISQSFTGTPRAQRGAPRFKWNAGLRGDWANGLSGEIDYHYVGAATYPISSAFSLFAPFGVVPPDTRVGSYNLLNMRAGYRFWEQKAAAGYLRNAEVAVSVFNALNDEHKEHPLGDAIGRRVMGWLTVRF